MEIYINLGGAKVAILLHCLPVSGKVYEPLALAREGAVSFRLRRYSGCGGGGGNVHAGGCRHTITPSGKLLSSPELVC